MPDETAVPCPECNCPLPDYSGYPDFMLAASGGA